MPPPSGGAVVSGAIETGVPREKMYFGNYVVQPMSNMRQKIAEHMVMSKRVSPHVYSIEEVNVNAIAALRAKSKAKFERGNVNPTLSPSGNTSTELPQNRFKAKKIEPAATPDAGSTQSTESGQGMRRKVEGTSVQSTNARARERNSPEVTRTPRNVCTRGVEDCLPLRPLIF